MASKPLTSFPSMGDAEDEPKCLCQKRGNDAIEPLADP
jgi:hypothetical protein